MVRVSLTSYSKLGVVRSPLWVGVFHTTYVSVSLIHVPTFCAVCLCVCDCECVCVSEGDLGQDKAPQIKLSTLLA